MDKCQQYQQTLSPPCQPAETRACLFCVGQARSGAGHSHTLQFQSGGLGRKTEESFKVLISKILELVLEVVDIILEVLGPLLEKTVHTTMVLGIHGEL